MAKVTAPIMSFSASGQLGKSVVFFTHLGRNVVRGLVTPLNPKTPLQGMNRLLLAAYGRATRPVVEGGPWLTALRPVIPVGQTWVSMFVRRLFAQFSTPLDLYNGYENHPNSVQFQAIADQMGLTPVTVPYAGVMSTLQGGVIMYTLAVFANQINQEYPGIWGTGSPWNRTLALWDITDINNFHEAIIATA